MIVFGLKAAYAFFSIPITFYVEAMFIEPATSKTACKRLRLVILKGFQGHRVVFSQQGVNVVLNSFPGKVLFWARGFFLAYNLWRGLPRTFTKI
jgi:hypothetical protein